MYWYNVRYCSPILLGKYLYLHNKGKSIKLDLRYCTLFYFYDDILDRSSPLVLLDEYIDNDIYIFCINQ